MDGISLKTPNRLAILSISPRTGRSLKPLRLSLSYSFRKIIARRTAITCAIDLSRYPIQPGKLLAVFISDGNLFWAARVK